MSKYQVHNKIEQRLRNKDHIKATGFDGEEVSIVMIHEADGSNYWAAIPRHLYSEWKNAVADNRTFDECSDELSVYLTDLIARKNDANHADEKTPIHIVRDYTLDKTQHSCDLYWWFIDEDEQRHIEDLVLLDGIAADDLKFSHVKAFLEKEGDIDRYVLRNLHCLKDNRGYVLYVIKPKTSEVNGRNGATGPNSQRLSGYIYDAERDEISYTTVDAWRYVVWN